MSYPEVIRADVPTPDVVAAGVRVPTLADVVRAVWQWMEANKRPDEDIGTRYERGEW